MNQDYDDLPELRIVHEWDTKGKHFYYVSYFEGEQWAGSRYCKDREEVEKFADMYDARYLLDEMDPHVLDIPED